MELEGSLILIVFIATLITLTVIIDKDARK